jgi:uncharacterized phage protein (predicted DNA packaging)
VFTLECVKEHLRIDHELEDALIAGYMEAAKDFAETFLGRQLDEFEALPATILAGLLVHTAMLYESREGEFIQKNLPAVRLLYWPHRAVSV